MHGVGTQDRTLSRLDGWPMRSPVNASPRPSRATAHDLGPMWIATPSSQGTFTLYSLPVSRRFAYLVRFTPVSDRRADIRNRQLRAKNGHMQCSKPQCYSITSSARESRSSEILIPSALAVLRLITISNLVDCSTGSSAGLAPLR